MTAYYLWEMLKLLFLLFCSLNSFWKTVEVFAKQAIIYWSMMEIDRRIKADRCEADYVYIPNNGPSSGYGHFSYAVDVQII